MASGKVASSVWNFFFPPRPGNSSDYPLEVQAVPGLTTLLDVAVFRANEGQLTATICSSHTLLKCWLDLEAQARDVLQALAREHDGEPSAAKVSYESLARQALETALDALERMSTDKLAQSGNLSDPYESIASGGGSGGANHPYHHQQSQWSGVGTQGIAAGIEESKEETGRRLASMQRASDCWESPRLHCPDHVWAEDCFSACQRWVRSLSKHPMVVFARDSQQFGTADPFLPLTPGGSPNISHKEGSGRRGSHSSFSYNNPGHKKKQQSSDTFGLSPPTERKVAILIQLIQDDLPMRLYQFKQAMEADAVVTKRLYLVKCEYRAPLRAFLEAHQSLLRAPPMDLVASFLSNLDSKHNKSSSLSTGDKKSTESDSTSPAATKIQWQTLLQSPSLMEILALERECEQLELDVGNALFGFCELARSLDHKKARLKTVPGVLTDASRLVTLQDTVRRLKCALCRKGGSETSTGIRPILLDLQQVRRDDNISLPFPKGSTLEERVDDFLSQLETLSTLLKTRNAFWSLDSSMPGRRSSQSSAHHHHHSQDIDFSVSIVKSCTEDFDPELLKCQLLDWMTMVERQHDLVEELQPSSQDGTPWPNSTRQVELQLSIAGIASSEASLLKVQERLDQMYMDRQQRLEVLQEMVQEVGLRELNLHMDLQGPDPKQSLTLHPTSAVGFLGQPLLQAGHQLPIG